jgi:hypothetical protein
MSRARRSSSGERGERVKLLRALAAERVAETSLRAVAREIGMSAPGLALFLDGTSPRHATLEKIHAWHLKGAGADGTSLEAARTSLHMLASSLPPGEYRVRMIRTTLAIVAELHRKQGSQGPPWLAPLYEEYGAEDAR